MSRDQRLEIRLSQEEKAKLLAKVKSYNQKNNLSLTISDYIRHLISK